MSIRLWYADCKDLMSQWEENRFDSIVTDPPYGLEFMGKEWDKLESQKHNEPYSEKEAGGLGGYKHHIRYGVNTPAMQEWHYSWTTQALRVLKPGGHALVFGGTRTHHRLMCALEDAGFEIRDVLMWVFGSGFPKSMDISKQMDKQAGADRKVVGRGKGRTGAKAQPNAGSTFSDDNYQWPGEFDTTSPSTNAAKQWEGWGTALKPAYECIILCRKPISEKNVASNVLRWGVGGLNIDGCRVPHTGTEDLGAVQHTKDGGDIEQWRMNRPGQTQDMQTYKPEGRFPANLIHDGSEEVLELFPNTKSGALRGEVQRGKFGQNSIYSLSDGSGEGTSYAASEGSAARFFYSPKASKSERGEDNKHPTVKPLALMRYLCRLITPPDGTILDPFMGSGSTILAATQEGFGAEGIESDQGSFLIACKRLEDVV